MPKVPRGRPARVSTRSKRKVNSGAAETNSQIVEVNPPVATSRSRVIGRSLANRVRSPDNTQIPRASEGNEEISTRFSSENHANMYLPEASTSRESPALHLAPVHMSREGSISTGATSMSGLFSLPPHEPENPIPFRAALEFIPKSFDGYNLPVSRFINDCIYARNSIAAKDRQYLFLMIRTRIEGRAYVTLQDRDIHSLEDLLRHLEITFTETHNLFQLNNTLANVAQRESENVLDYGTRVGEI